MKSDGKWGNKMSGPVVTKVNVNEENAAWSSLNYMEKNWVLFLRQKATLDTFLARGAISQAQHDKSLRDLIEKMGKLYGMEIKT